MKINVLDKGYVKLADKMGSDLSIVNAARVSYDKESQEFSERDKKLLDFLIREEHTSPFRHATMTFEIYAPLFVARQWWKYAVASSNIDDQNGWNESSRRYITENEEFYIPAPNAWRSKPDNSKQGSGAPIDIMKGKELSDLLEYYVETGTFAYNKALEMNVAPEIARLFLPAYAMYVRWRWTASLQAVVNFLQQRLPNDAQFEIREYAVAVKDIVKKSYPHTYSSLFKD